MGVRLDGEDLVDQRVAVGRPGVAGRPDQAGGHLGGEQVGQAGADAAAGGDVDHLGEQGLDVGDAGGGDALDPHPLGRVVDERAGPVAGPGDGQPEARLGRGRARWRRSATRASGLRLIAVEEPANGVTPWSKRASATCDEGRSMRTSHPAQPQPGQGDAERDDGEDARADRAPAREQGVRPEQRECASSRRTGGSSRSGRGDGSGTAAGRWRRSRRGGRPGSSSTVISGMSAPSAAVTVTRQRQEPQRPGQRPAHVQPAEVVHLRERPAHLQRPGRRRPGRQPEQQVDDVLLADEDGQGEVGQGGVRRAVRRWSAGQLGAEEGQVRQEHQGGQAVVVHQAGVFEQRGAGAGRSGGQLAAVSWRVPGRGRRSSGHRHALLDRCRSSAALSTLPRSVSGQVRERQ